MVPQAALDKARTMLEASERPIFLHDDDCDGTTAFVICYQFCRNHKGEGKSVPIKRTPSVTMDFMRKVEEFNADLIVILDKPRVDSDFLQGTRLPILWIDHHEPQRDAVAGKGNVHYINPRIWDDKDTRPTSYWSYQITKTNLWIATVGSVGDWFLPDYVKEFNETYPDLAQEYTRVQDAYLDSPIGTLVRVIQFNLKGQTAESRKSILTLTRIEHPDEILKQTTSRGRFLWKKYERLEQDYEVMLKAAMEAAQAHPGKVLLFLYTDENMTFTSELSNELLIRYPQRAAYIIGRRHDGRIKASLRSNGVDIAAVLAVALKGLDGYGGGHRLSCGMNLAEKDWDEFYRRFSALVEEQS